MSGKIIYCKSSKISFEDVMRYAIPIMVLIAVSAGVSFVFVFFVKRSKTHLRKTEKILNDAECGELSAEERHKVARELIDMTVRLLACSGVPRGKCEFASDYAKRVKEAYPHILNDIDTVALFDGIAAEEFGMDGMNDAELRELAGFYRIISDAMPTKVSALKRFVYRYFKLI